jgi:hypothetical protein
LGWVGASGAVAGPGTFELISTTVLASNTANVTFSITGTQQSTYKHLQLRILTRNSANVGGDNPAIVFNSDSTYTNYRLHYIQGDGTSATSNQNQSTNYPGAQIAVNMADSSFPANVFGAMIVDVLDAFNTNKYKTVRSFAGSYGTTIRNIGFNSSLWMNTAAISSITVQPYQGLNSFATGSRFSLYGIRG